MKLSEFLFIEIVNKAKWRKYQGVFKIKSRFKTRQVREIKSQQLEHKQYTKRGRKQVSGRVTFPCWHATPVAKDPCKPLIIR